MKSRIGYFVGLGFVSLVHFNLTYACIGSRTEKDYPIGYPPKYWFQLAVPIGGEDSLSTGFGSTRDIMRQRWSHLNLKAGNVANGKAKNTPSNHHHPEAGIAESSIVENGRQFTIDKHKRKKEQAGV